jgi:hypothetical protein
MLEIHTLHICELFRARPLHFEDLVVASTIVERVRPLGEVVHDIVRTQDRDPGRIVPRNRQQMLVGHPGVHHFGAEHKNKL